VTTFKLRRLAVIVLGIDAEMHSGGLWVATLGLLIASKNSTFETRSASSTRATVAPLRALENRANVDGAYATPRRGVSNRFEQEKSTQV
jgi:hypothetical protein